MSEIAAILLMFLPKEDAFWALAPLMVDDRHAMHGRGPPGCWAGGESGGPPCRLLHRGGRRGPPSPPPLGQGPHLPGGLGVPEPRPPTPPSAGRARTPAAPPTSRPAACLPPRPPCQPTATRGPGGSVSTPCKPSASLPSPTEGCARPSPSPWPAPAAPWGWGPACPCSGSCRREGAGSAGSGPQPPAHAPRGLCRTRVPGPRAPHIGGSPALWEERVQSGLQGRWAQRGQGVGGGPCPDTPTPPGAGGGPDRGGLRPSQALSRASRSSSGSRLIRAHPPKSSPQPEEAHGERELLRPVPGARGRGWGARPSELPRVGVTFLPLGAGLGCGERVHPAPGAAAWGLSTSCPPARTRNRCPLASTPQSGSCSASSAGPPSCSP